MKSVALEAPSPTPSATAQPKDLVLVGFAEALAAPEVVWSLADDGFKIIAFARRGKTAAIRHSRYVECFDICPPEVDLDKSLSELSDLLEQIGAPLKNQRAFLFPLDDKAVWLSSKLALEHPWILGGPQDGAAELALDKHLQCQAAGQAGFAVPEGRLCKTAGEIVSFVKSAGFPVILKAADAVPVQNGRVFGCPKWICATEQELDRAIKQWAERAPLLVQKFVTGTGEGLFGIAAPDGVRAWSAHRRLRMMNPQGSGSSACVSQSVPDDLKHKAQRLIDLTGWRGLFMIELLRDQSGQLWFVELNGRPWGSIALARKQKLEYPAWQIRLLTDPQSPVGMQSSATPGVVCRNAGREFMHMLFVIKGSKSKALSTWPPIGATLRQVLAVHKGDTFYNLRRDDLKVFFADFYHTIHQNVFKHRH
jgi:hypothetical protein